MLIDHTARFKKLRGGITQNFTPDLFPVKMRNGIEMAKKQLFQLKMLQDRQCLPSFTKRKQKKEEINRSKSELRILLSKLDESLKNIAGLNYSSQVKMRMKDHFATSVHTILIEFKDIQHKYLKKIKDLQIFDDLEDTRPFHYTDEVPHRLLSQKKQHDIENVRDSLYFITSMLLEMKTIIASHTEMIDRIDFLMDEAQNNIHLANEEIEKIPEKYGGFKDKFIIFLIIVMICLLTLLMLKFHKRRIFASKLIVLDSSKEIN